MARLWLPPYPHKDVSLLTPCNVLRCTALPQGRSCKDLKNHRLQKPIILSKILTSRRLLLELVIVSTHQNWAAPQPVCNAVALSMTWGQLPRRLAMTSVLSGCGIHPMGLGILSDCSSQCQTGCYLL